MQTAISIVETAAVFRKNVLSNKYIIKYAFPNTIIQRFIIGDGWRRSIRNC